MMALQRSWRGSELPWEATLTDGQAGLCGAELSPSLSLPLGTPEKIAPIIRPLTA